ncbi:helix-turn-helix domain-containing protein [Candidimonas nitroreducens]|uniref:Transcriptional regulator n=1 Tax=Candidimonas nitroreducens TaxID=683354 RepID=A0A225M842_9BURK|nr:XRE family transcriptional regulator [Candidimonas nitroreducens]OWT55721.1 transcriptional regulator [Candidimonas nitroreducens]
MPANKRRGKDEPDSDAHNKLGRNLRRERTLRKWSLKAASEATGVASSTLSKIENGIMSPTFDILQRIVQGMSLDLTGLLEDIPHPRIIGRRSITRAGEGVELRSSSYIHSLLATDLSFKKFLPFRSIVTARSMEEFGGLVKHRGEEFFMVLKGEVEFHSEFYNPARLRPGDSVYLDSQMGHALLSIGKEPAEVIWVSSTVLQ